MGKKRKKKIATLPEPDPTPDKPARGSGTGARWIAVALLVLGTAVFLYAITSDGPPADASAEHPESHGQTTSATSRRDPGQSRQFRYFEDPNEAHPLPVTLPPSEFANPGIASSYAIAKEIPEVLAQQPCLCGCDNTSDDHRSLLDCFIDDHASTCMVCMKEAVFAKQMTDAGESAGWIRDAILRHEFSAVNIGN